MTRRHSGRRTFTGFAAYTTCMRTINNTRLNNKFDTDAATYSHLRELDAELPDHVWRVIIRYRPNIPAMQWHAVREFTITNVVLLKPRTFHTARRLMTMTTRFTAWVWTVTGIELTTERVYTQNNVSRYLQDCLPTHSESYRWWFARQLRAIAESLADTTIDQLPTPRLPGRRPLTVSEVASMHSWAGSLTTLMKRQNAWAILGLAGGAGLRTEEIINTRVSDIDIVDGRVFVNVPGPRPRRVPVMHPWNRTLLRSIQNRTGDAHIFHGYRWDEYRPRIIQQFLTEHPATVRATVSRLRSTWIITQIENGLPLGVLMTITGFASTQSLDRHLVYAKNPNLADYVGLITGEEVAR